MYPKQIIDALSTVRYPGDGKNIVENGMLVDDIRISGYEVSFSLLFQRDTDPFMKSLVKACEAAIHAFVDEHAVVHISPRFVSHHAKTQAPEEHFNQFKKIIAVHSGKGGVGKSTVASNLAVCLAKQGYSVGLLDADIYGPSMPKMFNVENYQPLSVEEDYKTMIAPAEQYGVSLLSIGFFVDASSAIVWRGGMASNAIQQLLHDGHWGTLDFLLIDLPPGTSDIHLTIVQNLKLDGVIIVTTPQQVAVEDARKGIDMFQNEKINVPVVGIVENMSWFTPAELPDNKYFIFGKDGGKQLSEQMNVPLIAQIPLIQAIQEAGDEGMPICLKNEKIMEIYKQIAKVIV